MIPTPTPPAQVLPNGDINLKFPGVDVNAVAKAVLGDILGLQYNVDPSVHGSLTVVTPHPIRRADVLGFFEQALTNANLTLTNNGGVYSILPTASARGAAPTVGPDDPGYGNETLPLKFVNADQMQKLLDPLVPGGVSVSDSAHNILVISGNAAQRRALRDLVAQFDVDWLKGMSFALFVPQRTDARLIAPELQKLLNAPGSPTAGVVTLIAMDQLNGILAISSNAQNLEDVRRFVEVLDREGESSERAVFVYKVQNGRAADLAKVLDGTFGIASSGGSGGATGSQAPDLVDHTEPAANVVATPATTPSQPGQGTAEAAKASGLADQSGAASASGATITADETNNAIVVYATPRIYALVQDALRKLDVPPLQVMIDASISEVSLNHDLQYGIQWAIQSRHSSAALTQNTTSTPLQNFPGFSYMYDGVDVQATLNALKTVTDVTTLSAPKLMVLNNHTATIEVGDQVPISTGSATVLSGTSTSGTPIVNSVEYRDTGIILKITPRVNSGGLVLLDIAQEVSDALPVTSAQISAGINSPTIEQRKIATSVAVEDGDTVALGGLIKNEVDSGRSTVPLFGDIPILGHLFGDTSRGLVRTELVVLLTPRVVRTPVDAAAITAELRDKIHLAEPPPPPSHKQAHAAGG
ncbi:MAG: type II secretion system secretin GspD [Caulobacteraceae bacterium]|nr:type II secretion system secretin GspD [Caulobacteraceae bacterium]